MNSYVAEVLVVLAVVETGALLWLIRRVRSLQGLERVEQRLSGLTDALTLLTETSEAGFRAGASEIARLGAGLSTPPAAPSRTRTRQARTPVRSGAAARRTTASESASEGERRLRLKVEKAAKKTGRTFSRKRGTKREEPCQVARTSH